MLAALALLSLQPLGTWHACYIDPAIQDCAITDIFRVSPTDFLAVYKSGAYTIGESDLRIIAWGLSGTPASSTSSAPPEWTDYGTPTRWRAWDTYVERHGQTDFWEGDIDERGVIQFGYSGPDAATVTPEPATVLLLGSGFLALAFLKRKRRA